MTGYVAAITKAASRKKDDRRYRGADQPHNAKRQLSATPMRLELRARPGRPGRKSRRVRRHRWVPA